VLVAIRQTTTSIEIASQSMGDSEMTPQRWLERGQEMHRFAEPGILKGVIPRNVIRVDLSVKA